MLRSTGMLAGASAVLWVIFLVGSSAEGASEQGIGALSKKRSVPAQWAITIGAQLYDDWPLAMRQAGPFGRHPLWAGDRSALPTETWRCVNCHGWDFRGDQGIGGDLGPLPGAPGLRHLVGSRRDVVKALIRKAGHGFERQPLNIEALDYIALFLAEGQAATVELASKVAEIEVDRVEGGERYANVCQLCHGADGAKLNLGTERRPETLRTLARRMPWKFLHAVRFGHGGIMPSFILLQESEYLNLLSYAARDL